MSSTKKTEGWKLPREIVELIFFRLSSFVDRVRFRSVCRWWQSFLPLVADCHSPPYLYYTRSNQIYSITDDKTYYFQNHDFFSDIFCTSNGWFVLIDPEAEVSLFNPFSGAQVSLPALWALPGVEPKRFDHINDKMVWCLKPEGTEARGGTHLRCSLLMSMCVSPALTTIIIYNGKLAFASPCSQFWTRVTLPLDFPQDSFEDVTYHEADGKFYAISSTGATLSISQLGYVETIVPYDIHVPADYPVIWMGPNIVSLPTDELLCIFILFSGRDNNTPTPSFDIRKLIRKSGNTPEWVRVESLEDWTIFLDSHGGCARGGTEHDFGYKKNCVYFSLTSVYSNHKGKDRRLNYNGIFDIVHKSIEPIYDTNHSPRCAFWIEGPKYA